MATIHISLAEAQRNLSELLAKLDENTTFLIENGSQPVALLQPVPLRKLSLDERIALLPNNSEAVMDDDFARDLEFAINRYREPIATRWD